MTSYYLIIWLVAISTNCTQLTNHVVAGSYASRTECEAAFSAAAGGGVGNNGFMAAHLCVKASAPPQ